MSQGRLCGHWRKSWKRGTWQNIEEEEERKYESWAEFRRSVACESPGCRFHAHTGLKIGNYCCNICQWNNGKEHGYMCERAEPCKKTVDHPAQRAWEVPELPKETDEQQRKIEEEEERKYESWAEFRRSVACESPGCRFHAHTSLNIGNYCCNLCRWSKGTGHGYMCERAELCKQTVDRPAQHAGEVLDLPKERDEQQRKIEEEEERKYEIRPEFRRSVACESPGCRSHAHTGLNIGNYCCNVCQWNNAKEHGHFCELAEPCKKTVDRPAQGAGEVNSKAGADSDSETSGMPDLLRDLLRKANPEWRRKDLVSVEAKLAKVGVHTVDAFVEALHGRLNEGLRAAGLKTFNAETIRALRKCACGDKSMEKSVIQPQPRAVATIGISTVETLSGSPEMNAPPETLEVSSADKAINRNSLSSGAADAQAEEKPDGAHGDTDDLYQ